ncbi:hypothetical protein [Actinomadura coerulea]|uniref:hypothetical protein n=1 Tax=Actinomadura coerulea TaxID=46159 RepID=UPI00342A5152
MNGRRGAPAPRGRSARPGRRPRPSLRTASGRDLLLDGTHRAVAAYGTGAPVTLFVFALRGPAGPETLPDLVHHL